MYKKNEVEEKKRKATIIATQWRKDNLERYRQYQNKRTWEIRNIGDYKEWQLVKQIRKSARKEHKENIQERRLKIWQEKIKKITRICPQCERIFEDQCLWRKSKNKYCSRKCLAEAQKVYKTPEQIRAYRRKYRRNGNGGISREAFDKMRAEYNYTCPLCGEKEPFLEQYWPKLVQDHIIPRGKGGRKRSKDNIQPLCWNCNIEKADKLTNTENQLLLPIYGF